MEAFRTDAQVRGGMRFTSVVRGVGLLAEALVRVPLVLLLPIEVVVGLSAVLDVVKFAGLISWNIGYVARARRRAAFPGR